MHAHLPLLTAAVLALSASSAARAQVTGSVRLDGKAPEMAAIDMSGVAQCSARHPDPVYDQTVIADEKGNLSNVIVAVKLEDGQAVSGGDKVPDQAAVLDQIGCMYTPRVLPVMVGQALEVRNSDEFLHNVNGQSKENPPFNFGQPTKDPGRKLEPLKAAETFKVKCDVHPWMTAWVRAFEHPFFATTKPDGTFEIKNLPDGQYTLTAWHEKYGEKEQRIEVKDGKAAANFTFDANANGAAPAANAGAAGVTLASLTAGEKAGAAAATGCCATTPAGTCPPTPDCCADGVTVAKAGPAPAPATQPTARAN